MAENNESQMIDLRAAFRNLWAKRRVFYIVVPTAFVLSAALILCVPRYYRSSVLLAPESQSMASGMIGSLASSFGFDLGSGGSEAINPQLYPDIVKTTDFLVGLFSVRVATSDGKFEGTYYEYMNTQRRYPFWKAAKLAVGRAVRKCFGSKATGRPGRGVDEVDPFWLTRSQNSLVEAMRTDIVCAIDKKTDAISVRVEAQDKLVAATMADSVCQHLQNFMTAYRTQKAKDDIEYYSRLIEESKVDYEKASREYINYKDSHSGLALERYKIEAENLQNEMELKYSVYSSFQKQYLASCAKLQEDTPAFTIVQSACVAEKPAGPKRVIFVLAVTLLATFIAAFMLVRKDLKLFA